MLVSVSSKQQQHVIVRSRPSGSACCNICCNICSARSSLQAAATTVVSAAAVLLASRLHQQTHLSLPETQQESSQTGTGNKQIKLLPCTSVLYSTDVAEDPATPSYSHKPHKPQPSNFTVHKCPLSRFYTLNVKVWMFHTFLIIYSVHNYHCISFSFMFIFRFTQFLKKSFSFCQKCHLWRFVFTNRSAFCFRTKSNIKSLYYKNKNQLIHKLVIAER